MNKELKSLIGFLSEKHAQILDFENKAKNFLEKQDVQGYKDLMRQKAELLADLIDDSLPLLKPIPQPLQNELKNEINYFSSNASEALELDSIFYMSALLFRDDYKEGEPDNLKIFIDQIENIK